MQCFDEKLRQDLPAKASPKHFRSVLDTLAQAKPRGTTQVTGVLHDLAEAIPRRALVIVFSDFFTDVPALLDSFQHMRFRKHDLAVFHLIDPQETSFEFDRSIRFADLESDNAVVAEPAAIRDAYLREINAYLDDMRRGCLESHVDYQRVDTSLPYAAALTEFLLKRQTK